VSDTIEQIVDRYHEARAAIFAHVGYVQDWRALPIDDSRDQFWAVDAHEREWVKFSPNREALVYWLGKHADEYGPYGNVLFEHVIYTQRHLPKWVYRGAALTLVVTDTQTDGNKLLQLFRNENEARLDATGRDRRSVDAAVVLNLEIDRMIDADKTAAAPELLVKVREQCARVPLADLRIAIDVHRRSCQQPGCPVLAVMEQDAALRGAA
jgi:hypothetical protein